MRPPEQARWNPLPGDVASNGKAERTVVDRGIQSVTYRCPTTGRLVTCTLRAWIDWFTEEYLMEEEMRKTRPPLTLEQQRQLVNTRRTATLAALSLIRVGSTPQDLHERIRAAELECGLWVDAVERLRKMEAKND